MYDPKFSQKQMYDQYGRSRQSSKSSQPAPSRASTFDQFQRRETNRGLGSKPSFGGAQDNNPNRDEAENKSTIAKVYERAVDLFKSFGADKPKDVIVDGKKVYQGPAFRGYDPTARIGQFGGEYGKKNYFLGMEKLGIPTYPRTDVSPTLPPSTINAFGVNRDNPRLNMFGVNRSFTQPPASPELPTITPQPQIPEAISVPIEEDYIIEVGDTLSEIAQKRGTTVDVLLEMNDIADKDKIYAGDKLKVPVKKLTDTQAALRRGLGSKKDMSGIQFASLDPQYDFYQSMVPMDQRIFEPELGADAQSVEGYDDVPQMTTGLMSQRGIMPTDYDTVEKAQQRLNDLGFVTLVGPLEVDGILGKGTARQLRKFQATANIPTTGKLDAATKKALKNNKNTNKEGKDPTADLTNLSEGLYQQIKAPIAKIESGGEAQPYAAVGGSGRQYDGKYQFGWRAKTDLRNNPNMTDAEIAKLIQMNPEEYKELSDEEKARVGPQIEASRAAFRADPNLQEKSFRLYINQNHNTLTRNSAKYRAMDEKNKLAVLGYAHNQGAEAALEWLTTKVVGLDAFGTRGDKYSAAVIKELSKRKAGK